MIILNSLNSLTTMNRKKKIDASMKLLPLASFSPSTADCYTIFIELRVLHVITNIASGNENIAYFLSIDCKLNTFSCCR